MFLGKRAFSASSFFSDISFWGPSGVHNPNDLRLKETSGTPVPRQNAEDFDEAGTSVTEQGKDLKVINVHNTAGEVIHTKSYDAKDIVFADLLADLADLRDFGTRVTLLHSASGKTLGDAGAPPEQDGPLELQLVVEDVLVFWLKGPEPLADFDLRTVSDLKGWTESDLDQMVLSDGEACIKNMLFATRLTKFFPRETKGSSDENGLKVNVLDQTLWVDRLISTLVQIGWISSNVWQDEVTDVKFAFESGGGPPRKISFHRSVGGVDRVVGVMWKRRD